MEHVAPEGTTVPFITFVPCPSIRLMGVRFRINLAAESYYTGVPRRYANTGPMTRIWPGSRGGIEA